MQLTASALIIILGVIILYIIASGRLQQAADAWATIFGPKR